MARGGRLGVAVGAALLAVAAMVVVSALRPSTPLQTMGPTAGPPIAELRVVAATYECCQMGGIENRIELQGPGGPWIGALAHAEIGSTTPVIPRLPEKLAEGVYLLRTDVHQFGDAIYPGESGPRELGMVATCATQFAVAPETRIVGVTLGYWNDRCAAVTVAAADPDELPRIDMFTSIDGACGLVGADAGGCEYRLMLLGPGSSWEAVIESVKPVEQLVRGTLPPALAPGAYTLGATTVRMSTEPLSGAGFQHELGVAARCGTDFAIPPGAAKARLDVRFIAETCTAQADVRN